MGMETHSRARLVAVVTALMLGLIAHPARADPGHNDEVTPEIEQILAEQLAAHPGGTVVGNAIYYEDDLTFVAVEADVMSLSQCTSGKFCGWGLESFQGSFYSTSGSGVTRNLNWQAKSYSNNRARAARLYNNAGTGSTCFNPRANRSSIGSAYHSPEKVYLSSTTSC